MTATQDQEITDLQSAIAALRQERDGALAREAALAEVLGIINRSPGDPQPVFDAILQKAHELCGSVGGSLVMYDGEYFRAVATHGQDPEHAAAMRRPTRPNRFRPLIDGERMIHFADLRAVAPGPEEESNRLSVERSGTRSMLAVPMRKDGALLGYITANRREVRRFSDSEIALLETFAEQAVVAIRSAETFRELEARTAALAQRNSEFTEQVERQAATIDVLKVMSSSTNDTRPVFDIILRRAMQLCNCAVGAIYEFDGELTHLRAILGFAPDAQAAFARQFPAPPRRENLSDRAILERRIVHIRDVDAESERFPAARDLAYKALLAVPLMREGVPIGVVSLCHRDVDRFTDADIELLKTFAEQAVISIGSVATFRELQDRTAALTRSVSEPQALEEVLRAVNSSLDLETVLVTIINRAVPLAQADEGMIYEFDTAEQVFVPKAAFGMTEDRIARLRERRIRIGETPLGISAATRAPLHIPDLSQAPEGAGAQELVGAGINALLAVPLLREDSVVGGLVIRRRAVGGFVPTTVTLMQTFAAQCVLAIENARLFEEFRRARAASDSALADLRRAQDRLIQSEKMASLGQLTAGIAHEIKNPLNFVNNFSALSAELVDELQETLSPAPLAETVRTEVNDLTALLKCNLEKVVQHGKRADGIVKAMLEHSRGGSGERRTEDINALAEEALNLAYHGARAQDQGFNITLDRDFGEGILPIELNPQDMTRVFLNLFSNGFYASNKRARSEAGFTPTLKVTTRDLGDAIEIRVRDNGTGIPPDIREMLFQPFFTTKPTGEGTGLGLSITYDIVTKGHGGTITVESEVDVFSKFVVALPRPTPANEAARA